MSFSRIVLTLISQLMLPVSLESHAYTHTERILQSVVQVSSDSHPSDFCWGTVTKMNEVTTGAHCILSMKGNIPTIATITTAMMRTSLAEDSSLEQQREFADLQLQLFLEYRAKQLRVKLARENTITKINIEPSYLKFAKHELYKLLSLDDENEAPMLSIDAVDIATLQLKDEITQRFVIPFATADELNNQDIVLSALTLPRPDATGSVELEINEIHKDITLLLSPHPDYDRTGLSGMGAFIEMADGNLRQFGVLSGLVGHPDHNEKDKFALVSGIVVSIRPY